MASNLEKADNALLIVVLVVGAFIAFSIVGALISTIWFAIKMVIIIAALAVGWRVATAIGSGAKRRELNR